MEKKVTRTMMLSEEERQAAETYEHHVRSLSREKGLKLELMSMERHLSIFSFYEFGDKDVHITGRTRRALSSRSGLVYRGSRAKGVGLCSRNLTGGRLTDGCASLTAWIYTT
ncbi:hypothetical protein TNIN_357971 [Trichonephila inaurata madagascariensis]|uniref:Uncharacterized protein n=1 Tax=Trichonephila inaurata madagascariensis TaxID=2747483 RepID=A0A8X6K385_9ARAC|nr:hypothetical protein TNIN_357971 [Trichonephila inaurata madagascariensis]